MKFPKLTYFERASGITRIKRAEFIIACLPQGHEGRANWLQNYGTGDHAIGLREGYNGKVPFGLGIVWDEETESAQPRPKPSKVREINKEIFHLERSIGFYEKLIYTLKKLRAIEDNGKSGG
ncbi:hypothetical protein LCGC14_1196710 [marine sediment metagenome]|uniref:Uncharacterized protein n=1 Tax=marine sediment metagenome TaxID=412755 RepID=A0A0F9LMJ6_9ZZZZ